MASETNHPDEEPFEHPDHFLREWREFMNWSQEELAAMADVHYTTIGRIETGKRKLKTQFLGKLARIFGVPSSAILETNPATESGGRTAHMLLAWNKLTASQQDDLLKMVRSLTTPNDKASNS